jgi:putative membrane protein
VSGGPTRRGGFFVDDAEVMPPRPPPVPARPIRPAEPEAIVPAEAPPVAAPAARVAAGRRSAWLEDDAIEVAPEAQVVAGPVPGAVRPPWWRSPGRVLLAALGALLAAAGLFDAWRLVAAAFAESALLGTLFTALFGALAGAAGWTAYGVRQDLARLASADALREQATGILADGEGLGLAVEDYLAALQAHYAADDRVAVPLERFRDDVDGSLPAQWQLERLSTEVFGPLDKVAFDTVNRHAQQAALLAMLTRIHFADFLIALWRSLALVRQIARTYGARPGTLGTARLWRGVLRNVVYAEVSEIAADTLGQVLGGGVAAKFSAQAAQGLGMGMLIGRLGLEAIRACRPLPFTGREVTQPSLKVLGEGMLRLVRGGVTKPPP